MKPTLHILPEKLNDGDYDYQLVSQELDVGENRKQAALYERVPPTPDYYWSPELDYLEDRKKPVKMFAILRK